MAWQLDEFAGSLVRVSANTVTAYSGDLRGFVEWAERGGATGPADIDRLVLRRYLAHLATRRYAKRTVARKASALRRYFGWCRRTGLVTTDPTAALRAPSGDGRLPRVLGHGELDLLLAPDDGAVRDEPDWVRLRDDAVLELLYGSGLRVSELCGLDWDRLELDQGAVVVWGKGGKQRRVPLSDPAVDALRAWRSARPVPDAETADADPAVFLNRRLLRLGTRDVRRLLDRRARRTDPPPRPAPQLRDPSARRRGRPASRPGTPGPRRAWPPPSATPTSARNGSARSTSAPILEPELAPARRGPAGP